MKKLFILLLLFAVVFVAFNIIPEYPFPKPKGWPKPEYNFTRNKLNEPTIQLGRALFYDPILSKDSTISCASCHSQYTAFAHIDHALSHGINDRIGTRNAPALMNLAWNKSFMWDGAINHLDMQALAPITHPDEMGETLPRVIFKMQHSRIYPTMFLNAFGDSIITGEHLLKSISQFMLILISANSKYDSVMRHEKVFNEKEKKGYLLFQKHCASCHNEPLFTNNSFENNGLPIDTALNDYGRMRISKHASDSMKFKVPTLRNIEYSSPYMHDGRFKKLREVYNHYSNGITRSSTLSKKLQQPILLSSNERVDLTAFLLTLTDQHFLFNPMYSYPKNIFIQVPKE